MASDKTQSVIVYDGSCSFCRRQVSRIQRWDKRGRFELLARQSAGIEDRFPRLAEAEFNTGMRLIEPDGRIFVGADAVYHIARALPFWRAFAWLYRVPGIHALARWAYAWVAARRLRLAEACELPDAPPKPPK